MRPPNTTEVCFTRYLCGKVDSVFVLFAKVQNMNSLSCGDRDLVSERTALVIITEFRWRRSVLPREQAHSLERGAETGKSLSLVVVATPFLAHPHQYLIREEGARPWRDLAWFFITLSLRRVWLC